jgi:hypothetical protein
MRICSGAALLVIAAAVSTQTELESEHGAPIVRRSKDLESIASETDTDRLLAKIAASAQYTSTAVTADGSLMQSSIVCFTCVHGRKSSWWHWTCTCNSGWEGRCCDQPTTCSQGMGALCPQNKLTEGSYSCASVDHTGPLTLGTAEMNLPKSLQGIFWLTKQGDSSSLMSFATSRDGDGLSQIDLSPIDGNHLKIRVGGDKVWCFADKGKSWILVRTTDLVYEFAFKDANGRAPTNMDDAVEAQIIPYAHNLGIRLSWTQLLDFSMKKLADDKRGKYNTSVVWGRPSAVFGIEVGSAYYDLVQIIDGNGKKLEPAYSDWLAYCKDEGATPQTGSTPGKIYYHEYER